MVAPSVFIALQAALAFTPEMLKRTMAARMPRMAMTTRSSTSVNPPWPRRSRLLASAERFTLIRALNRLPKCLRVIRTRRAGEDPVDGPIAVVGVDDVREGLGRGRRLVQQVIAQELHDIDARRIRRRRGVDLADGRRANRIDGTIVVVEVGGPLDGGAVGLH